MASYSLPPISSLPKLSISERAAILDILFEPCTQLHTLAVAYLQSEVFPSYNDMIASIGVLLTELAESNLASDTEWLDKILGAHPRLGEKKVESVQSRAEQAQLKVGGTSQESELLALNHEYELAFPGLKYVYVTYYVKSLVIIDCECSVFVNGRDRTAVMADMRARIKRANIRLERSGAIKVCNCSPYSSRR